jgi:hypothetical protein
LVARSTSMVLATIFVYHLPRLCDAHSSLVACSTLLPVSGHGGSTTPGAGTVTLSRGESSLPCGSPVFSGESLVISVQGTSGT